MNIKMKKDIDGNKFYYLNGKLHREDGPAIEFFSGRKDWYRHGFLHREDGPAIEWAKGKFWILNDKRYGINDDFTNESWKKFIKTLIFS